MVRVGPSPVDGRGMFAVEDIHVGTSLGFYMGTQTLTSDPNNDSDYSLHLNARPPWISPKDWQTKGHHVDPKDWDDDEMPLKFVNSSTRQHRKNIHVTAQGEYVCCRKIPAPKELFAGHGKFLNKPACTGACGHRRCATLRAAV